MADFINKQELLPRYERGLPDIYYDMLDKLNKLNEFYAKQLACTVPKVYIATDLQPKCGAKMNEVEDETQNN